MDKPIIAFLHDDGRLVSQKDFQHMLEIGEVGCEDAGEWTPLYNEEEPDLHELKIIFYSVKRIIEDLGGDVSIGGKNRSCPCLYTTPCQEGCTCVHPHSSRGCTRCCTYGSREQRRGMAKYLAKKIDSV